jgi:hypothetical protein
MEFIFTPSGKWKEWKPFIPPEEKNSAALKQWEF